MSERILFVFVDGVGLAPPGPDNPLSTVPMPHLHELLGGPLVRNGAAQGAVTPGVMTRRAGPQTNPSSPPVTFRAVDACLGVAGLPQSATGQTALFTGLNAPALVGDHVSAYPTAALREMLAEHSLLKQAADAGARVIFANAHSERFWRMIEQRKLRLGASTLTALAAGSDIPDLADLVQGRAVLWDITHEIAAGHLGFDLPVVSPEQAGARLARLATEYDLVFYETFLTDLAGHRRIEPEWVLPRLDAFLGAVLAHRPLYTTLVVCSDHGNLEDATTKAHTRNAVPLLAVGPAAGRFSEARAITDVAPTILSVLEGNNGRR